MDSKVWDILEQMNDSILEQNKISEALLEEIRILHEELDTLKEKLT